MTISAMHTNSNSSVQTTPVASGMLKSKADRKFSIRVLAVAFACFSTSPLVLAQATRTWVSGVGDDVNPCSRTAPCKTFAGAISKTAPGGEINALDPGGYGSVTITKSMTVDGDGTLASILASGTNGVVINAGASGIVSLRNLNLNGNASTGIGINIIAAAEVNIERCVIAKFATRGIFINCTTPCRVNIRDTIVRDCVGGAVFASPNSVVTMNKCSLLASQFGLRVEGGATATLEKCVISGHLGNAVSVDTIVVAGQAIVNLNDCLVTDNSASGIFSKGATTTVRLSNNTITGNLKGITIASFASVLSYGNNQISGNTTDGAASGTVLLK